MPQRNTSRTEQKYFPESFSRCLVELSRKALWWGIYKCIGALCSICWNPQSLLRRWLPVVATRLSNVGQYRRWSRTWVLQIGDSSTINTFQCIPPTTQASDAGRAWKLNTTDPPVYGWHVHVSEKNIPNTLNSSFVAMGWMKYYYYMIKACIKINLARIECRLLIGEMGWYRTRMHHWDWNRKIVRRSGRKCGWRVWTRRLQYEARWILGQKMNAPSGNRARGISMATRYFTTKPIALHMHTTTLHIPHSGNSTQRSIPRSVRIHCSLFLITSDPPRLYHISFACQI